MGNDSLKTACIRFTDSAVGGISAGDGVYEYATIFTTRIKAGTRVILHTGENKKAVRFGVVTDDKAIKGKLSSGLIIGTVDVSTYEKMIKSAKGKARLAAYMSRCAQEFEKQQMWASAAQEDTGVAAALSEYRELTNEFRAEAYRGMDVLGVVLRSSGYTQRDDGNDDNNDF